MPQVGDAKRDYPGLSYRNDADLKAWLAKRAAETALEPDLPIIDPHHHFWDTPHRGHYFLPELLADIGGGHNIVATVFLECQAMYRKDGPAEMAPVGEVEFVNGIAAMSVVERLLQIIAGVDRHNTSGCRGVRNRTGHSGAGEFGRAVKDALGPRGADGNGEKGYREQKQR